MLLYSQKLVHIGKMIWMQPYYVSQNLFCAIRIITFIKNPTVEWIQTKLCGSNYSYYIIWSTHVIISWDLEPSRFRIG